MTGCAGHYVVTPVKSESTAPGFRYYLPKPYLLVTNMNVAADTGTSSSPKPSDTTPPKTTSESHEKEVSAPLTDLDQSAGTVMTVKIIWLPDTSAPYSVTIAGAKLGSFKGGLQLTNGWMLTNVNEESDAKVAETMSAFASLVGSVLSPVGARMNKEEVTPPATKISPFLYLFEIDTASHELKRVDTSLLNQAILDSTSPQHKTPSNEK